MSHPNHTYRMVFLRKLYFYFFFLFGFISLAQVKIGDNPESINPYIILELESTDKAFLFPRMTSAQRDAAFDLNDAPAGLAIFNTTSNQLEVLNSPSDPLKRGSKQWLGTDESVAQTGDTPPENPSAGQLFYNTGIDKLMLFDGSQWQSFGSENSLTYQNLSVNFASENGLLNFGLTDDPDDSDNEINLRSLEEVRTQTSGSLPIFTDATSGDLVIDTASEKLTLYAYDGTEWREFKPITQTNDVAEFIATDGQKQFTTPLEIETNSVINVFRNGVMVNFTVIDSTTIELESQAVCYQDDQIKIFQYNY